MSDSTVKFSVSIDTTMGLFMWCIVSMGRCVKGSASPDMVMVHASVLRLPNSICCFVKDYSIGIERDGL